MSVFFSRFMGNVSQCGTNKSREPRCGSPAICLFRTAIHFPWTEKKRSQFTRFVCSALRFISHEPRKKDTHSLYLQCIQQRPLLKFSEQSKKFKFPAEIGHLTLFQDKTILAYSFRQNSAGSCSYLIQLQSAANELVRSLIVLDSESSVFKLESTVVKLVSSVI